MHNGEARRPTNQAYRVRRMSHRQSLPNARAIERYLKRFNTHEITFRNAVEAGLIILATLGSDQVSESAPI